MAVKMSVHAHPSLLGPVRAVTADMAMREDFDLDAVEDLRLAVDEMCSILIRLARDPEAELMCALQLEGDALRIKGSVLTDAASVPDSSTFSWSVLSTLADLVTSSIDPAAGASWPCNVVGIEILRLKNRMSGVDKSR